MTQAQEDHREKMLGLARQWRESGRSAQAFAQEHAVTPWMLYAWRKRLARAERRTRRRRRASPRVRLAPVQLVTNDGPGSDLEVVLASGDRIRVPDGISTELLQRVIHVLRTRC
jgi:hypothetical protein